MVYTRREALAEHELGPGGTVAAHAADFGGIQAQLHRVVAGAPVGPGLGEAAAHGGGIPAQQLAQGQGVEKRAAEQLEQEFGAGGDQHRIVAVEDAAPARDAGQGHAAGGVAHAHILGRWGLGGGLVGGGAGGQSGQQCQQAVRHQV